MSYVCALTLCLGLVVAVVAPATAGNVACPTVAAPPITDLPNTRAAISDGRALVIVAIGSSSTEGSHATVPAHAYPARLQDVLTRALSGTRVAVLNKGIGGQDAADTMARFDQDVIAHHPALAIWQVGANGALRDTDPADFRGMIAAGIARLQAAGIDVVLMDNQRAPQIERHPHRVAIEQALAEQAAAQSVGLFPRGALMDGWATAGYPNVDFLASDGLHHNDRGYDCVARALAAAIVAGVGRPATIMGANP